MKDCQCVEFTGKIYNVQVLDYLRRSYVLSTTLDEWNPFIHPFSPSSLTFLPLQSIVMDKPTDHRWLRNNGLTPLTFTSCCFHYRLKRPDVCMYVCWCLNETPLESVSDCSDTQLNDPNRERIIVCPRLRRGRIPITDPRHVFTRVFTPTLGVHVMYDSLNLQLGPSKPKWIQVLALRLLPTLDLNCEENVVWRKWKCFCTTWTPKTGRKLSVSRWDCKNRRHTNSQCNVLPMVHGEIRALRPRHIWSYLILSDLWVSDLSCVSRSNWFSLPQHLDLDTQERSDISLTQRKGTQKMRTHQTVWNIIKWIPMHLDRSTESNWWKRRRNGYS